MPAVGSHVPQAKNAGSWKNWSKFWAKNGGTWKRPVSVHVKSGGTWVKVYDERPVITDVTTSYSVDTSNPSVPFTTYNKNFTVAANGFETTLTSSPSGATFSQSTISVDGTVAITSSRIVVGDYDPANMHTVTATNSSGTATA